MNIKGIDKSNYNEKNNSTVTSSERCLAIPEILEKIFIYSGRNGMRNLSQVNKSTYQAASVLQNKGDYPKSYQKMILQVFASLFKEPVEKITSCFVSLSEKNKNLELKLLIDSQKFNEIDLTSFKSILQGAISSGHEQVVKTLMTSQKFNEIGLDNLGEFIKESAKKGYTQVVKEVIDSSNFEGINGRDLGVALYQATLNKHEELAIELLNVCHSEENIPADPRSYICNDWGEAFKYAAQNGLDGFIKQFITFDQPFGKIILNQLESSLILASTNGHLKVVEAIIASSRFHEITQDHLNTAYQNALSQKYEQIAEILKKFSTWNARCVIS